MLRVKSMTLTYYRTQAGSSLVSVHLLPLCPSLTTPPGSLILWQFLEHAKLFPYFSLPCSLTCAWLAPTCPLTLESWTSPPQRHCPDHSLKLSGLILLGSFIALITMLFVCLFFICCLSFLVGWKFYNNRATSACCQLCSQFLAWEMPLPLSQKSHWMYQWINTWPLRHFLLAGSRLPDLEIGEGEVRFSQENVAPICEVISSKSLHLFHCSLLSHEMLLT